MNPTFRSQPASSGRRGFTLIELLTVIAIIGILAAILIPVVGKVREQAKVAQCAVQLRDLGTGMHLFSNDNDDWAPPFLRNGMPESEWGSRVDIHGHLGLLLSPRMGGPIPPGGERWSGGYLDSAEPFMCPSTRNELYDSAASGASYKRPTEIGANNRIERIGYMYDYRVNDPRDNSRTTSDFPNRPFAFDFPGPGTPSLSAAFTFNPHEKRMNVLHVGGHVTSFSLDEIRNAGSRNNMFDLMAGEER